MIILEHTRLLHFRAGRRTPPNPSGVAARAISTGCRRVAFEEPLDFPSPSRDLRYNGYRLPARLDAGVVEPVRRVCLLQPHRTVAAIGAVGELDRNLAGHRGPEEQLLFVGASFIGDVPKCVESLRASNR